MTHDTALKLQDRIHKEIAGLRKMVDQLDQPETAATMAGLKSGLTILTKSLRRTNQLLYDMVRAEVETPAARNPFAGFLGR